MGSRDFFLLRLFLQDRDLGFEIGRLNIGDQSPLEAAAQPVFNFGQLFGGTVAGDDDLLHGVVQGVKRMEKFFLRPLLAGQKLNVIDQQDIDATELVAECGHLVVAQRVDHVIGELLAGDVADGGLGLAPLHLMPDGLHEMGFAHAHAAIQEQRVVGFGGTLGHGLAGGVGELVAAADDEGVEGVAGIQLRGAIPIKTGLGGGAGGGCRNRREAAIMFHRGGGGIVLRRDEFHIVELEPQVVDRFLDEVRIFVGGVLEIRGGHPHEQDCAAGVAVTRRFQPRVVGVAVDFLFQRVQNARPRIGGKTCTLR